MKAIDNYIYFTEEDAEALAYAWSKHSLNEQEGKRCAELMSV